MTELRNALDDYERPALAEWMEDHPMLGVIVKAARRYQALLDKELHRETEDTCRTCRDEPEASVHDWDTYESSERWVTEWQELSDPALIEYGPTV